MSEWTDPPPAPLGEAARLLRIARDCNMGSVYPSKMEIRNFLRDVRTFLETAVSERATKGCYHCGHTNTLNGEIVHASNCPVATPVATTPNTADDLIGLLRGHAELMQAKEVRPEIRTVLKVASDLMEQAADALEQR